MIVDTGAVNAVAELAKDAQGAAGKTTEIGERTYSTVPLHEIVQKLPEPAALVVHTLTGLADYLEENRDLLLLDTCLLHVVGPDRVDLVTKVQGEYHQRFRYVTAQSYDRLAAAPNFRFGNWFDLEDMNVALQALFEPREDRAALLRLIGNIKDEASVTREDDGISQRVTSKAGIALVEQVPVPNPVTLAPFRTFVEVEQPRGTFVFRLRKGGSGAVQAVLFEADGGAWRNDAVASVAAWLGARLGGQDIGLAILA